MEFFITLSKSKWAHWGGAAITLFYSILGSFFPIWGGAIVMRALRTWTGFTDLVRHGELAIYSATFLTTTILLIAKENKKKYGVIFPVLGLLVSALIFAVAISKSQFDEDFVIQVTIILLVVTILLYFFTNLVDIIRSDTDIQKEQRAQIKALSDEMDKMEGK